MSLHLLIIPLYQKKLLVEFIAYINININSIEIILQNFSEIRRRNIKLWTGIPNKYLDWRPDDDVFTVIEMIWHMLEGEHLFHKIIENRGDLGQYQSSWSKLKYSDVKNE